MQACYMLLLSVDYFYSMTRRSKFNVTDVKHTKISLEMLPYDFDVPYHLNCSFDTIFLTCSMPLRILNINDSKRTLLKNKSCCTVTTFYYYYCCTFNVFNILKQNSHCASFCMGTYTNYKFLICHPLELPLIVTICESMQYAPAKPLH